MGSTSVSLLFSGRYSTPEAAEIWTDSARQQYCLDFEAKLALVLGRRGIIPQEASEVIQAKCDVGLMDLQWLADETTRTGNSILPLVKEVVRLGNEVGPGLGEWVHWGATTQDVTDTATVLQLRDTCKLVADSLDGIIKILHHLSLTYNDTPMAARSVLQHAVPITFGFKLARLLATFQRHKQRLSEILQRLLVVEFGGAAGTLAAIADTGVALQVQEDLAKELGLSAPDIAWHTERDRIAEVGAFFALITATCAKFALDVKLMMQTEVGEVSEGYAPHKGSSSTMPQKRNPVASAYIITMASTVKQMSTALYDAMVEEHERSDGPWEIEWIVLPQISNMTHATLQHTLSVLRGLEVYPDVMKANLELTRGGIVSEAVMMALAKKLGRQTARDLLYDICRELAQPGSSKTLFELLLENKIVQELGLGEDKLEAICKPSNYVGLSREMVHRVLQSSAVLASN